jgi:hypothetical protein
MTGENKPVTIILECGVANVTRSRVGVETTKT